MKRLESYKKFEYLFHVLCWMIVFIPHIFVMPKHEQMDARYIIMWCVLPMNMYVMFYLNYLFLVPMYLMKKKSFLFSIINIPLLFLLAYGRHLLFVGFHNAYPDLFFRRPVSVGADSAILHNISPLMITIIMAILLHMSIRWYHAEKARNLAELQRKDAELKSLRSQINPHFLLNTLNGIYALIEFDKREAQQAVASLAVLLRQMLYGNNKDKVNLREEVLFISNYVDLMRIRLADNVKVEVNVSIPDQMGVYVAPMIFMSLVENAFKHGVSTTEPSYIGIDIHADEDKMECEVSNSNYPKTDSDGSEHGIGLKQLRERLDILYPNKYHWEQDLIKEKNIYNSKLTIYDTKLCNY